MASKSADEIKNEYMRYYRFEQAQGTDPKNILPFGRWANAKYPGYKEPKYEKAKNKAPVAAIKRQRKGQASALKGALTEKEIKKYK